MKNIYSSKRSGTRPVVAFLFVLCSLFSYPQINLTTNNNAGQLAQVISGNGVAISNVTLNGANVAAGTFNCVSCSLGLDSGIVLTTGCVSNIIGPNNNASITCDNNMPGDSDLAALINDNIADLYDACILEFDLQVQSDSIHFNYVFGSEEYPEFACSEFDDVFAFFISGPGIAGMKDIALIPSTNIPVSINTVNGGPGMYSAGYCNTVYQQYYVNNGDGNTAPYRASPYYIQYDGLTKVLTAKMGGLSPCQTYHLKLAIADLGDPDYDSGIFIEANSLTSSSASFSPVYRDTSGMRNAVRGCTDGIVTFHLQTPASQNTTVHFHIGGTAVSGTDYNSPPDSIIIPADSTTSKVIIHPTAYPGADSLSVIFYILNPNCNNAPYDSVTLFILSGFRITSQSDSATCGNNNGSANVTVLTGTGPFNYLWRNNSGDSIAGDYVVQNLAAGIYTVAVTDFSGCTVTDSVIVNSSGSGSPVIITSNKSFMCSGDSAHICAPAGFNIYQWNVGPSTACIYAYTTGDYYVQVTGQSNCNETSNHIHISVSSSPALQFSSYGDTLVSQNAVTYQWFINGTAIQGATMKTYVATESGSYTVEESDTNGCYGISTATQITVSGIDELNGTGWLKVYPNPSISGNWQLAVSEGLLGGRIEIYDDNGRLVYKSEITSRVSNILPDVARGVYTMRVTAGATSYNLKLIKLQ